MKSRYYYPPDSPAFELIMHLEGRGLFNRRRITPAITPSQAIAVSDFLDDNPEPLYITIVNSFGVGANRRPMPCITVTLHYVGKKSLSINIGQRGATIKKP